MGFKTGGLMGFSFPKQWFDQNELAAREPQRREKLEFSAMLPGCVGFVTKCGRVVMYGEEYKRLKEDGIIE